MTPEFPAIPGLLSKHASQTPNAPALLAPGRLPLSYARLTRHVDETVTALHRSGYGCGDVLAIVLPNGPEMATAFLAAAAAGIAAPLNPAYPEAEFDFYLQDLNAKAVITLASDSSLARLAAQKLGIPVLELSPETESPAGLFRLAGLQPSCTAEIPGPDDTALVLHTSGTTSRPKIVPLTHRNLCVSAANVKQTLQLSPADRCLNIMPLFHIHGLVAALLASLAAGASVVCTPGFYAPQFFPWVQEYTPTWYTAVPTMHQSILRLAEESPELAIDCRLRFIRSSSASLPPQVMASLEAAFNAPVVEAYGMTEAAHQMASNPLPPQVRKPGSVGRAAGPELTVLTEDGQPSEPGQSGEVAVRGENITPGYLNRPEANAAAFTAGWFRTGDQGYLDTDGYLFLTGRLKEIINRGGEKISPREVDEVLLDHPSVAQVVTFALPDPRLGEDVAAAVVLKNGPVTEKELRQFAAARLAYFKIPRRIVILPEIPRGPTGKLQRIGLAEKLGLTTAAPPAPSNETVLPPSTEAEIALIRLWSDVLGKEIASVRQGFLDSGGDSILTARLAARIRQQFGIDLSLLDLLDAATIEGQAALIEEQLLAEIENLSDDAVERLLNESGGDIDG